MSSLAKTQKSKTINKNIKTNVHSTKSKQSATKKESFISKFKNLDIETATQLPSLEEEKFIEETPMPLNKITVIQEESLPVIRYENGMIEVDIWATHEQKSLWETLIHF